MTYQEWLESVNGKYIEVAGSTNAKNQCVDCANDYIKRVLGLPYIEWTNAIDFPQHAGDNYEFIWNTSNALPIEGDLMIFDIGINGHISIFIEGNLKTFRSMDENYPVGSPCHIIEHNYNSVIGWLHPKSSIIDDMTDEQKLVLQKIETFYKSNDKLKNGNLEGAVNALIGWASELTNISNELQNLKIKFENCITKEQYDKDKITWNTQKEKDIKLAIETAIIEVDTKWQEKTKDYDKIKESGEYKFAEFLFKLLHLIKKAGE